MGMLMLELCLALAGFTGLRRLGFEELERLLDVVRGFEINDTCSFSRLVLPSLSSRRGLGVVGNSIFRFK